MDIMNSLHPIGIKYKEGKLNDCINDLNNLWNTIPEPKYNEPNAYLIIEYFSRILMEMNKNEEALQWAIKGTEFNNARTYSGESEFLIGRVAYQMGYIEFAKDMFIISKKRSKGRSFKGENPEYLDLLKNLDFKI